jgi:hypothetical protein
MSEDPLDPMVGTLEAPSTPMSRASTKAAASASARGGANGGGPSEAHNKGASSTGRTGTRPQEWRLEVELGSRGTASVLQSALEHLRGADVTAEAAEVKTRVAPEVLVTHDRRRFFAYASEKERLDEARESVDQILRREGFTPNMRLSRWDELMDRWQQVEPPPDAPDRRLQEMSERLAEEAEARDREKIETRTVTASAGKLVRAEVEQAMIACADKLGLECVVEEHPRLLTTQVRFTVTGSPRTIDRFWRRLIDECGATIRREENVLRNPGGAGAL